VPFSPPSDDDEELVPDPGEDARDLGQRLGRRDEEMFHEVSRTRFGSTRA
jgi:hypothetical protein